MIRTLNIVLAFTTVVALVGVYAQKHMTENTAAQVRALEGEIAEHQSDLSILQADWAYLNQPNHIQALVERHNDVLGLQVAEAKQFVSFEDLPMRPKERLDTEALDDLFQTIDEGEDPIGSLLEGML